MQAIKMSLTTHARRFCIIAKHNNHNFFLEKSTERIAIDIQSIKNAVSQPMKQAICMAKNKLNMTTRELWEFRQNRSGNK